MKKILIRLSIFIVGSGLLGALVVALVIAYFSFGLPKISTLADYNPPIPSQIMARDGTVLTEIGKETRYIAKMDEIPKRVINAFLSAEDDNFYEHKGVDYLGVMRAFIANLRAGKVVQGGSTITQQVAKSLLLSRERSISRKIKDFLLAQRIEEKFTKEEILFLYLNQVYLGGGYYGVKAAFKGYFGKELTEASIAESAIVAGLLVAPGRYSPYINPQYAKKRQGYVLGRMYATGKITEIEYNEALAEKIKFRIKKGGEFKAGYLTDWVRQRIVEEVGNDKFLTDGFKVVTTIDFELQQVAEKEVYKGVKEIDKRQGFKGPLRNIETEEKVKELLLKQRKDLHEEKSTYFTLKDDLSRLYESEISEEITEKREKHTLGFFEKLRSKRYYPGNIKEDPILDMLSDDKMYEAVVRRVDNRSRIVYVSFAGLNGFIPYEGFRWAHERNISEERQYYPYVTRPSTILKAGDVIQVSIVSKSTGIERHIWRGDQANFKKSRDYDLVKNEKYIHFLLDQEPEAEGALVSLDPKTGELIALVGGADFEKSQFDRAIQSHRQPGSSFKPILFAAGLENGFTPASTLMDSPEALGGVDSSLNWKPRNYDGKFKGPMTFRNSLETSRNIPTIRLASDIGVEKITEFTKRIGFKAKLDQDLSLALGSFGVTLMDIVATYAIFPNGGKIVRPKSIISVVDRYGKNYEISEHNEEKVTEEQAEVKEEEAKEILENNTLGTEAESEEDKVEVNPYHLALGGDQVYDPRLAYIMTNLLRGVVQNGTGRRVKDVSAFIGGKTGTTNNYVDAWFLGFASNIVTGVWTGFDNNKTLGWGETGAKSALPIWKEFMRAGIKKKGEYDYQAPLGVVNVLIDKQTGKLAGGSGQGNFLETFVEGTEPGSKVVEDVEKLKSDNNTQFLEEDDYYNNQ
ncbi:putative peptidoglycan transglycosylase penicillin-binding protein 1A [Halobacteriovorax marinus SJ]|uniref:Penicillin-binding protein 1A n=1 Tax=Halobacteriovorax marinus (strain ATCC BAA-682 / DSM 15412 / SJ) TaxID=862908 RepID=E1X121_HALMS|nr:PBP1A family penicillin-binding protein [Halobacteriovorax marinus]CBW28091.1 putative peptidoglycan transglycosylase penicillin-binding protein 1A [Halobacteriovorax marinus SJ]